ncbi:hypothetical protein CN188_32195, partial [Sinorhizobium meliloti]
PWGETGFQLCGLPTASLGRGEGQAACRLPPCGGLVGEMAGRPEGVERQTLQCRRRRICREHTLQHSEDAVIRLRHVVLMGEQESRPPLACRPSPPQGGRIPAAGPRSRFCVLPVASFWACEGQTVYRLPQGNGPAGGSDVYMP